MHHFSALIAVPLILAACATKTPPQPPWTDNFGEERSASIPTDVREFVINAQACGHFSGEPPYDEERRKFLEEMITKTCTGLDEQKPKLLVKYAGNAEVKALIEEIWIFD